MSHVELSILWGRRDYSSHEDMYEPRWIYRLCCNPGLDRTQYGESGISAWEQIRPDDRKEQNEILVAVSHFRWLSWWGVRKRILMDTRSMSHVIFCETGNGERTTRLWANFTVWVGGDVLKNGVHVKRVSAKIRRLRAPCYIERRPRCENGSNSQNGISGAVSSFKDSSILLYMKGKTSKIIHVSFFFRTALG